MFSDDHLFENCNIEAVGRLRSLFVLFRATLVKRSKVPPSAASASSPALSSRVNHNSSTGSEHTQRAGCADALQHIGAPAGEQESQ